MDQAQNQNSKPIRPKRVSLKDQRDQHTFEGRDPNFEYRFVNDIEDHLGNRVERFKKAGWTPVQKDEGKVGEARVDGNQSKTVSYVERTVGRKMKAILMKIPKEWYTEDQAAKQKELDDQEKQMRRDALENSDYGKLDSNPNLKQVRTKATTF